MKYRIFNRYIISMITASLISGCATARSRNDLKEVHELVGQRVKLPAEKDETVLTDTAAAEKEIQNLLSEHLTIEAAMKIALLNNPSTQAIFEDLGIARADLTQSRIIQNPVFGASIRYPDHPINTNVEFSIKQNFTDILLLPLKSRLSRKQFEQAKLRVTDAVLDLLLKVKVAYYTVQGTEQMLTLRRSVLDANEITMELTERQLKVGNISALDLANQKAACYQAQLEYSRAESDAVVDREKLSRLMGFSGQNPDWKTSNELDEIPKMEPALEDLVSLGLSKRLDLKIAKQEVSILQRTVTYARFGAFPNTTVGLDTEKDIEGGRVTGPTFDVEIPLFDRKQGAIGRAKAQLRQSERRLAALEADAQSEIRLTFNRLQTLRKEAEVYREGIIPVQKQVVDQTQKHYNFMLLGVYTLLQAKQNEINSNRDYIQSLRDYWIARSELERAVGGPMILGEATLQQEGNQNQQKIKGPEESQPASKPEQKMPEEEHQHHH